MDRFSMTAEGYLEAEAFLKEQRLLEHFLTNMTSTDGYSLTNYANIIDRRGNPQRMRTSKKE